MHLNTTADKRFWVNEAPFLFLGEWCFLYPDKKENYAGSEVLKYPWDDRKLLLQNHSEVRVLYEVLLTKMVVLLNDLHGTHYSEKAWRIWIGPWLLWFLEVLFSRFLLIEKAVSSHKITSTITSSCELSYLAPRSYAHLNTDLWNSDVYNHLIFSEIIKSGFAGEIPYTEKVIDEPQPYSPSTDLALKRTKWPLNHSSLVFANSLLPRRDSYSLSLLLGKIPSVFSVETEPDITNTYSAAQRTLLKQALQVAIPMNPNPFERFIFTHLTNYIPKVYVEGFKEQLKYIDSTLSQHTPKVIVTGLGHLGNTSSIFWIGKHVNEGAKLVVEQHGGHYGSGLFSSSETHELEVADAFLSWGWKKEGTKAKIIPVSSSKLTKFSKVVKSDASGDVLLVLNSFFRYSYRLYSVPTGPQQLHAISQQMSFIENLSPLVREKLKLRLYFTDYGWNESARFKDKFSDIHFVPKGSSMVENLNHSRLCIGTSNTTGILETLSANYPSIYFWDPKHWELNNLATPYYELLRENKILFYDPVEAAEHVNAVFDDPGLWWKDAKVQSALSEFIHAFARVDKNWRREMKSVLKGLLHP